MRHTLPLAIFGFIVAGLVRAGQEPQLNVQGAIYAPRPHLSREAVRDRGAAGDGLFELRVRPDGTVAAVAVLKSTGYALVDREVSAAYMQWRFRSGTRKSIHVPFSFRREW
jgi:TonB family protein